MPSGIALALAATTLISVVGYVAWPILRASTRHDGWARVPLVDVDPAHRALLERHDAALRTLRDLDADHAVMRISDEDYQADRARAVAEAAICLQQLEGDAR